MDERQTKGQKNHGNLHYPGPGMVSCGPFLLRYKVTMLCLICSGKEVPLGSERKVDPCMVSKTAEFLKVRSTDHPVQIIKIASPKCRFLGMT